MPSRRSRLLSIVRVDLVLTDHILEGRSNTDLAAEIKAAYPNTPVVLQTGAAELLNVTEHVDVSVSKAGHPAFC